MRPLLRTVFVLLAFLAGARWAPAQVGTDPSGQQAAVAAQMTDLVQREVAAFFTQIQLPPPSKVEVETKATIAGKGAEAHITSVALAVAIATDQPSAVVREARQHLARVLKGQGYRFEATAEGEVDPRPLATLTVETTIPEEALKRNGLSEYAVFAALVLGMLLSLGAMVWLLVLPFRRKKSRPSASSRRPEMQDRPHAGLPPLPSRPEPMLGLGRPEELPVPPKPLQAKPQAPAAGKWKPTPAVAKPAIAEAPPAPVAKKRLSLPTLATSPLPVAESLEKGTLGEKGTLAFPHSAPGTDKNVDGERRVSPFLPSAAAKKPSPVPPAKPIVAKPPPPPEPPRHVIPSVADLSSLAPRPARADASRRTIDLGGWSTLDDDDGPAIDPFDDAPAPSSPEADLAQLPFEKALELLATKDAQTQRRLLEKMQLKAPLRRRLEKELAALNQAR